MMALLFVLCRRRGAICDAFFAAQIKIEKPPAAFFLSFLSFFNLLLREEKRMNKKCGYARVSAMEQNEDRQMIALKQAAYNLNIMLHSCHRPYPFKN